MKGSVLFGAGALAVCAIATQGSPQRITSSFSDSLTYYDIGEFEMIADAFSTSINRDPDNVIEFYPKEADAWIVADGPEAAPRRRLVAATFALELGNAGAATQWEVTYEALEWACAMLRRSGKPTEEERQWHLASIALLEASFEPPRKPPMPPRPQALYLPLHLDHVRSRFPKEPRLTLARALIDEFEYWDTRVQFNQNLIMTNDDVATLAVPPLEKAAAQRENLREASLRIGFLQMQMKKYSQALASLAIAAEGDDDPTRVHLAHLFTGWVHEREKRMDEAIASFRRAIAVINGQSAALALGVRLYAIDARDEADEIVTKALEAAVPDPWKLYAYGDYRLMPKHLARLRAQIAPR